MIFSRSSDNVLWKDLCNYCLSRGGVGEVFREHAHAKTLMAEISVIRPLRWSFWWPIYPSYGTQRVSICCCHLWRGVPLIARNGHLQTGKTLLTKFSRKTYWLCSLTRQRGKVRKSQVIADVDSRDPEARSFVCTEVGKILNSSRVCLVKGNEQRARSQPCVKGLALKGGYLAFLVALLANFTGQSCRNLLVLLALRKDLPIGKWIAFVEHLPSDISGRYFAPTFWTFAGLAMDVCVFYSRCCSTFFFAFRKFTEKVSCKKATF